MDIACHYGAPEEEHQFVVPFPAFHPGIQKEIKMQPYLPWLLQDMFCNFAEEVVSISSTEIIIFLIFNNIRNVDRRPDTIFLGRKKYRL